MFALLKVLHKEDDGEALILMALIALMVELAALAVLCTLSKPTKQRFVDLTRHSFDDDGGGISDFEWSAMRR